MCGHVSEHSHGAAQRRFSGHLPYQRGPVVHGTFTRWGDATHNPGWRMEMEDGHVIVSGWTVADPPIVLNTPWKNGQETFSILYFTDQATVELDGKPIEGSPYLRDIWQETLGGDRSSCVLALSESFFSM
ncbi:MAG: hypothetical protein CMJ81_01885 [Planctomycetaceae bacterium]|nr:hypothetical protein [Planctomycetaceae bacterium]